jgi:hypothetical protein
MGIGRFVRPIHRDFTAEYIGNAVWVRLPIAGVCNPVTA